METKESFDNAFMSYGAMTWLSDLDAWAQGVARVLRPGGRLVLLEFHPVLFIFEVVEDDNVVDRLRVRYPYSGGQHMSFEEGVSDYVAPVRRRGSRPMDTSKAWSIFAIPTPVTSSPGASRRRSVRSSAQACD